MRRHVILPSLFALAAGCTASAPTEPNLESLTRDDVRAMGGKGDHFDDLCDVLGWYGDGICDEFCVNPDPDCEAVCHDNGDCPQPACASLLNCPRFVCVEGECVAERKPCGGFAGLECNEDEVCVFSGDDGGSCGFADQMGECQPRPAFCPAVAQPVCGCDGETHGNACEARAAGTDVASEGACASRCGEGMQECPGCPGTGTICRPAGSSCPRLACPPPPPPHGRCGGFLGLTCPADQFCNFEIETTCGAGDQMGTCLLKPEACAEIYAPVCGCDGVTYGNECEANSAGVSVASEGACASDCRTSGCADGEYCSYCWGNFACIPEGAVC